MKQVALGSQGLRVPAIGLGCMGMSDFYGSSSEAQNLRVLDRAAHIGCTFWDTSDVYGPFTNERLLAKAVAGRRAQIILDVAHRNLRAFLDEQLDRSEADPPDAAGDDSNLDS